MPLIVCCLQVRPSVTVLLRTLDAYATACLYLRHQLGGSPAVAVGTACGWHLACVALCLALDVRNRRSFLLSRECRRPQGDLTDGGKGTGKAE